MNAAAAQEDHRDQRLRRVKAEGPSCDYSNLPVESLDATVVEAVPDVLEDTIAVLADSPGELDEGREPRAAGPGEPLVEFLAGELDRGKVEDPRERLLE